MSRTGDSEVPELDVYAKPFVPQVLRNVNLAPANVIQSTPARGIDFDSYVRTFAGSDPFTAEKVQTELTHTLTVTEGKNLDSTHAASLLNQRLRQSTLEPQNYHDYFQDALKHEIAALQQECEDHALYRVPIVKSNLTDPRPSMYTLHVPGLRELSLRIEVGDIVQLRQIRFSQGGEVLHGAPFKDTNGKPISLPRHADTQHNGVVWSIDRLKETLSLRVDNLKPRSMLFNVCFTVQAKRIEAVHMAVKTAQQALNQDLGEDWMRSMLFPEDSDGYYQKTLNKATVHFVLYDPLLNYEQLKAVNTVLNETYGPVPFIISGPPGTGKTKTVVELALQLIAKQETSHLLICAPSDPAADTLVRRLSKHLKPSELLRLNSAARSFPEVSNTILPFCFVDDGIFSLPSFEKIMRCKAVVTTCGDVVILLRARLSNRDLCDLEQFLHAAIHPSRDHMQHHLHWTGLLLDEAAQATEPEALLPMSLIAPPTGLEIKESSWPVCVLVGDQHQLGPRTASKTSTLQTSLFERLLTRHFYSEHPLARSKQSGGVMRPLRQDMLPLLRPAFANLIRNYRSHPAILATPSSLFYNDTLEPEAANTDALLAWPGWRGQGWPVLFACSTLPDEIEQDGGGWYNLNEAMMACRYAQSFLRLNLLKQDEICIMSPFRAQVRILRKTARGFPFSMGGVNIGPLEAFQGLEARLVIICTTRTRDRFIDQDVARGLGVIHEPKRLNVALTRAKEGLIVIGNPEVLHRDQHWAAFLDFCNRSGLVESTKASALQSERNDTAKRSRLERQLLHRENRENGHAENGVLSGIRKLGFVEDSEQELWQSGVATEQALRIAEEELESD